MVTVVVGLAVIEASVTAIAMTMGMNYATKQYG